MIAKNQLVYMNKSIIAVAGFAVFFIVVTIFFSPMIWLATIMAPLPITVMVLLFQPIVHMNLVERQNEENRE